MGDSTSRSVCRASIRRTCIASLFTLALLVVEAARSDDPKPAPLHVSAAESVVLVVDRVQSSLHVRLAGAPIYAMDCPTGCRSMGHRVDLSPRLRAGAVSDLELIGGPHSMQLLLGDRVALRVDTTASDAEPPEAPGASDGPPLVPVASAPAASDPTPIEAQQEGCGYDCTTTHYRIYVIPD